MEEAKWNTDLKNKFHWGKILKTSGPLILFYFFSFCFSIWIEIYLVQCQQCWDVFIVISKGSDPPPPLHPAQSWILIKWVEMTVFFVHNIAGEGVGWRRDEPNADPKNVIRSRTCM